MDQATERSGGSVASGSLQLQERSSGQTSERGRELAGSRALSIFTNPLHARVLRAHTDGPGRFVEVHEKLGWTARSSLRAAIANLLEAGALTKHETRRMPYAVESRLTPIGEELLRVADLVEGWLGRGPDGPVPPDSQAAKNAVKALVGGWDATVVRALASRPRSLTELDSLIPHLNYPSLERRIARMRATRQIESLPANGKNKPLAATEWLRRSVGPLCAASRCELRHMQDEESLLINVEMEAVLLLSLPLASLPESAAGTCLLAVQGESGGPMGRELAGVSAVVDGGAVASCEARVSSEPATWAVGSPETWLNTLIDGRLEDLRFGGADPQLAADLANGLHFLVSQSE